MRVTSAALTMTGPLERISIAGHNNTMDLTDNELHALVDGELPAERQSQLMAVIAADPALARRVCELRHLKAQVHLAYALPATDNSSAEKPRRRISRWPALAAGLLIAVVSGLSGWLLHPDDAVDNNRLVLLDQGGRGQAPAVAGSDETRIVVHVTNPSMAVAADLLNEVESLLVAYEEQGRPLRLEVISNGPGLALLREGLSTEKERIHQLAEDHPNLTFVACLNTINRLRVEKGVEVNLVPDAEVTRSGVSRVVKRQKEGWTYIKV